MKPAFIPLADPIRESQVKLTLNWHADQRTGCAIKLRLSRRRGQNFAAAEPVGVCAWPDWISFALGRTRIKRARIGAAARQSLSAKPL
jgi:hypothetical protein